MLVIPAELRVVLVGFVTYLLTQGLKALAGLLGKDFSGWAAAVVAIVVGSIMFFLDGIVASIPVEYHDVVAGAFGLIIAVLSAFGVHYARKNS